MTPWWRPLALVAAGLMFGFMTSLTNHGIGPAVPYLSKVIGEAWGWLTVGALAAHVGSRWIERARHAGLVLLPAVWSYYAADLRQGVYGPLERGLSPLVGDVVGYTIIGAGTAIGLATLTTLAKRLDVSGLIARLALPLYVGYDAWRTHQNINTGPHTLDPALQAVIPWVGAAAALAAIASTRLWRQARSSESRGGANTVVAIEHTTTGPPK